MNLKKRCVAGALALAFGSVGCESGDEDVSPIEPGEIETWAGAGVQGHDGDGHHRIESWFNQPMEMTFRMDGSAVVVDWNNHAVREIGVDSMVTNVIGTPLPGDWPCEDPANPANCKVPLTGSVAGDALPLNHPMDVVFAHDGSLLLSAWHNHKIERCDAASRDVTIVAGLQKPGGDGDNGPAAAARLFFPSSIVVQPDGGIVVSDEKNNRIRRIAPDATRTITTIAGAAAGAGVMDDGVPASTAALQLVPATVDEGSQNPLPGGALALGPDGTLYVTDTFHHCIRAIAPGSNGVVDGVDAAEETIVTVAGICGTPGHDGNGDAATRAHMNEPFDLEFGPDGYLYFADTKNNAVRCVDFGADVVLPIAGNGTPGFSGDRGSALDAQLRGPYGIAFDSGGSLFIVDTFNNRIRRVQR